jgi:homoserine kinase
VTGFLRGPVTVSVPATSANLGPGFDSLGLALDLRDEVTGEVRDEPGLEIVVEGCGAGGVALDERHLVHRAMSAAFSRLGVEVPPLRITCRNVVPHARGLGSSSAAIVAGICLARTLVVDGARMLDDAATLALAAELEGHPDNVAPALLGGLTVAWSEQAGARAVSLPVDPRVAVVVFVPPDGLSTELARGLLPHTVPHADAAANGGRAALLVAALGGHTELLLAGTEDRLHQDYREAAMPRSLELVRSLRADGVAATVSGAGPSVLAFTDAAQRTRLAARAPDGWLAVALEVDRAGARVRLSGAEDGLRQGRANL